MFAFWGVTIVPIVPRSRFAAIHGFWNALIGTVAKHAPQTRNNCEEIERDPRTVPRFFLGNRPHLDFPSPTAASVPPKHASRGVVGI